MGCTVDTVTLSYEQKMMTEQRAAERGLSDRVRVHLCDYRDLPPSFEHAFDALVSCEMVEVGPVPVPFSIRASDLPLTVRTGGGAQLPEAVRPRYRLGSQRGSGDDGHHGDQPARVSVYRLSVSPTARLLLTENPQHPTSLGQTTLRATTIGRTATSPVPHRSRTPCKKARPANSRSTTSKTTDPVRTLPMCEPSP